MYLPKTGWVTFSALDVHVQFARSDREITLKTVYTVPDYHYFLTALAVARDTGMPVYWHDMCGRLQVTEEWMTPSTFSSRKDPRDNPNCLGEVARFKKQYAYGEDIHHKPRLLN
jgi:hypothetical protein